MRALLVEDDEDLRYAIAAMLRSNGIDVDECPTAAHARNVAKHGHHDVALVDLGLPDSDGTSLVGDLAREPLGVPTICMTGCSTTESVVAAMRAGAVDYLIKPVPSVQLMRVIRASARPDSGASEATDAVTPPLGKSAAWADVLDLCRRVAPAQRAKVLITGESGTGKDVIARYIHALSPRRDEPFVVVNCACITSELAEAELFGHESGAFTGARNRRKGVLELADGGTLFLDEIGELPLAIQAKLLRVLEDQSFRRIGGETEIAVDTRFIFATNQPLRTRAESGLFRWDLYQRLAVFELSLPAVRERAGDVRYLVEGLLPSIARAFDFDTPRVDGSAWQRLEGHEWPGNVRELRNFLERAVVMANGVIDQQVVTRLLPRTTSPAASPPPGPAPETVAETKQAARAPSPLSAAIREHCQRTLDWADGNMSLAARQLGISRGTLRRHLRE